MAHKILSAADRIFCHFGQFFSPLNPEQPEKSKLKKKYMKKTPEDIIILHTCTINDNHVMYGS